MLSANSKRPTLINIIITTVPLLLLTLQEPCVQLVSQEKANLGERSLKSVYPVTTTMDSNNN